MVFNDRIVPFIQQYATKGSKLYIEGSLQTRKYTPQDGTDRYTTEIAVSAFKGEVRMLSSPNNGEGGGQRNGGDSTRGNYRTGPTSQERRAAAQGGNGYTPRGGGDLDDEIPF